MRIQHNILALNAYRNYQANTSALSKNLEKLSSGYRINRAGDDAAGLAISEKMRAQITGLNAAQKNVKDGISLVKTAEGAMQEVQDMLNRMDYLATQSANGTYQDPVDRENLQKEVDALRTEIDRIADSSNFNGINLLDGKLGLNTKAFTIDSAAAVAASDGSVDISSLLSAENAGATITHLEKAGTSQSAPAFTIDLGNLQIDASATTGNQAVKINALGKDFTLTINNAGGTGGVYSAADIATALDTAIRADSIFSATNNNTVKIGDLGFTMTKSGSTLSFAYAGKYNGATWKNGATEKFTADQATAVNTTIGQGVTVSDKAGTVQTGDVVHDTTQVDYAVAETPSSMAGINLTLDANVVKDGNVLTIDGVKYTFKTDANSTFTGNVIDVSAGKDTTEQIHMAVDKLSKTAEFAGADDDTTRKWKIASAGNDTIHIEQSLASANGKAIDTYDKLTSKISVSGTATAAKNAGTSVKIDQSKLQEGDVLTIDGTQYVFTKEAGKTDTANTKYVQFTDGGTDAAANLKAKVGSLAEIDSADSTKVIVRAAADKAAPSILGRGLVLQIGDTADSFNQLSVGVGDMHVKAMNSSTGKSIADINIGTQAGAQAAVQVIKDAINYVSSVRGDLGATQNRLEHTANNLSVMAENIQDAESTIRDTDVAEEMMAYTKNNILVQAAQAMLAQANAVPQGVLQLLQ